MGPIAIFKAFGYRHLAIGWQYVKLVMAVAMLLAATILGATVVAVSAIVSGSMPRPVAVELVEMLRFAVPVGNDVLSMLHKSEGAVQTSQTLLEVGNPQTLAVVVEVLSTAAVKIADGIRVKPRPG